ncbi:MAG TPA: MarR family winged helix-turn-helix transcriptional regulator [Acidimicrobiales bacterium]|nr:MarR family winged helix-turn-helix transcriptional regulator [Acidimicrobiales bacterium]
MDEAAGGVDVVGGESAEGGESGVPLGAPGPPIFGRTVGFLLSQLGFETARRFGALMSEMALEPRHFAVLRAIEANQGSAQMAIGDRIRVPPSSMVAVVDQLERLDLVERRPHPTDRRSRTLHLTAHGRDVLGQAVGLAVGFESVLTEGLSTAQREELIVMLAAVADNLGLTTGVHPASTTADGESPCSPAAGPSP